MSSDVRPPRKIFISYRREDDKNFAALVRRFFVERHGAANVFMDEAAIAAGAEFSSVIEREVERCDVLVALIGRKWVKLIQKKAIDEIDYVRMEIALALQHRKLVVPVCFGGEALPKAADIHYLVRPMLAHNSHTLHSGGDDEIERLLDSVDRAFAERESQRQREEIKQQAEELDKIPPAPGLALGYFANFVTDTIHRINRRNDSETEYVNGIDVTTRGEQNPLFAFGTELEKRKSLKLHIVIPPRIALLERNNLEPVLKSLKQALIHSTGSARPFLIDAWSSDGEYQLVDFPKALTVVNNWIRRRLGPEHPDPASAEWQQLEDEQLGRFELMLRWWLDDPNNGPYFRERVRLVRFTGEEKDLEWLRAHWPS